MGLGIGLTVDLGSQQGGTSISISAAIALPPFTIVDGETFEDMDNFAAISASTAVTIPAGYTLGAYAVVYEVSTDSEPFGVTVATTPMNVQDDVPRYTITATATADNGTDPDLTFSRTVNGTVINAAPVARTDIAAISLSQNAPSAFYPYDLFFEGTANFDATLLVAVNPPTVAGVDFSQPGGITIDPAVAPLQANTAISFAVAYPDSATSNNATLDVSIIANTVTSTVSPTLAQGFRGGDLLSLTNRDALRDLANYTGVTETPIVFAQISSNGVDFSGYDILDTAQQIVPGQYFRIVVTARATGNTNGPVDLRQTSPVMLVQEALSVSDVNGDGSVWSIDVLPGVPDAFVIRGLVIDGVENNTGLTALDIRNGNTQFIETHEPLPPLIPASPDVGDAVTLYEPVVIYPDTVTPNKTTERLRDGVVTAGLLLETGDDGTDLSSRTTHSDPSAVLTPLVSTSGNTAVSLPIAYTQTVFQTDGTSHLTTTDATSFSGATQFLFAGWFEGQASNIHIYDGGAGRIRLTGGGGVNFFGRDSNGDDVGQGSALSLNGVFSTGTLTHLVIWMDFETNTFKSYVNGVDRSAEYSNLPVVTTSGLVGIPAQIDLLGRNGAEFYVGDFSDVIIQTGTTANPTADPATLFTDNPTNITAHTLIGGSNQTLPALNAGIHQGTATAYTFDASGTNPFSEAP